MIDRERVWSCCESSSSESSSDNSEEQDECGIVDALTTGKDIGAQEEPALQPSPRAAPTEPERSSNLNRIRARHSDMTLPSPQCTYSL
jgi:hypothetical protein